MKKCPYCAEEIQDAAIKCRYCGSELSKATKRPPQEKVYFSDGAATVTNTRAIFLGTTYSMANITSVSMGYHAQSAVWSIGLVVIGAWITILGPVQNSTPVSAFGLLVVALGILAYIKRSKFFIVRISSASGEVNALQHRNRDYIQTIVNAVNQSIIDRR